MKHTVMVFTGIILMLFLKPLTVPLSFGGILSLVVTFWMYPFHSPKFFMETFKLHNDAKVLYLIWWFTEWALSS